MVVDERLAGPRSARRSASCPRARRERFESEYGLSPYDANVLVEQGQDVADYYDAVARGHRRVQAGQQLDPAGRAADDQGEEADRRRVPGPSRRRWPT